MPNRKAKQRKSERKRKNAEIKKWKRARKIEKKKNREQNNK